MLFLDSKPVFNNDVPDVQTAAAAAVAAAAAPMMFYFPIHSLKERWFVNSARCET